MRLRERLSVTVRMSVDPSPQAANNSEKTKVVTTVRVHLRDFIATGYGRVGYWGVEKGAGDQPGNHRDVQISSLSDEICTSDASGLTNGRE